MSFVGALRPSLSERWQVLRPLTALAEASWRLDEKHNCSVLIRDFSLTDRMSALKSKVIFWYVLPTSVIVFLLSVIGYSVYRYIHAGKEKHPSNLVSAWHGARLF